MPRELTLEDSPTLADDGGALVLDHPEAANDPWNDMAKDAVEPFDPRRNLRVLRVGDVLEAVEPCHRRVKVLLARESSVVVAARVWHEKRLMQWKELWAVRTLTFEDPQVPGRTWNEDHCMVIDEDRPPGARQSSLIVGKYVKAVKSPYTWDEAPGDVTNEPESAKEIPDLPDSQYKDQPKPRRVTFLVAKKLAAEKGIDISDISGAGAVARIMERVNGAAPLEASHASEVASTA